MVFQGTLDLACFAEISACASLKAEKTMTFPPEASGDGRVKSSMWIVRLLSLGDHHTPSMDSQ